MAQHESQTDAKKGFGGRFGVQKDRQDEVHVPWVSLCVLNWWSRTHTHTSPSLPLLLLLLLQLQAAVGWDYQAQLAQHESQTDTKKGFGGQFGVQRDRQDKVGGSVCYITSLNVKTEPKRDHVYSIVI